MTQQNSNMHYFFVVKAPQKGVHEIFPDGVNESELEEALKRAETIVRRDLDKDAVMVRTTEPIKDVFDNPRFGLNNYMHKGYQAKEFLNGKKDLKEP